VIFVCALLSVMQRCNVRLTSEEEDIELRGEEMKSVI